MINFKTIISLFGELLYKSFISYFEAKKIRVTIQIVSCYQLVQFMIH
jgi:hypothetical protein